MKLMLLFSLITLFTFQCGKTKNKPITYNALSVIDFRGRTVALKKKPERVVCLIESALSGIYMLHCQQTVVGISRNVYEGDVFKEYSYLDERIKNKTLPAPGNWDFVAIENVVALHPDLTIIWASQTEAIENLERQGIPVYGVMLKSLNDIFKEMADFGLLFDVKPRADSLLSYTKREIGFLQPTTSSLQPRKVYFMWSQGVFETSGKSSTVNELIELAGAKNACPEEQEHLIAHAETLMDWDPDIFVMWYNEKMDPKSVMRDPLLQGLRAVKNGAVFELPSVFYCDLWTLKFPYAVKLLANWCYPEQNKKFNMEKERISMLRTLYGEAGAQIQ